ncbi:serine O-acetyltransferase EpsC [Algoriphagus namhaensis]|uniref:Serine O-acetyltransferase EpsC n=1 Tax=Algoriphagus namhaensis TaxID=915353 RepID=A0ABV8ANK7_9BACT
MKSFLDKLYAAHQDCSECPSPKAVQDFFSELLGLLFPEFTVNKIEQREEVEAELLRLEQVLAGILIRNPHLHQGEGNTIARAFFEKLEPVFDQINEDIDAMYAGDPAAKSRTEIVRSYPGFFAIAAYRIAHELHVLNIKLIPRIITEFAHSRTGIDIHPGATIGHHFCIDHGTGVVIGETTQIGNHVKIYQGVTLGALSVNKEDADSKRHPTIGDGVVIYAGATILGGETHIGEGSVVGGNVWLTKSVPANSKIYYQSRMYEEGTGVTDTFVFKK